MCIYVHLCAFMCIYVYTKFHNVSIMLLKVSDLIKVSADDFSKPEIIGNYSIDGERRYYNDISQLKYYKQPPNPQNVNFNLDDNSLQTIHKLEDVNCKLDFMLEWISENFDRLKVQDFENSNNRWLEPDIICYRGLLINLLLTPYDNKDGWIICASKFRGTIYLCAFETDEKRRQKLHSTEYAKNCTAWGHKFEQYMLADTPSTDPDVTIPLNQNEEFCCIFKSKLGKTNLLYGAEVDGICSEQQIQDTLAGKNVELIELKTIPRGSINHAGYINSKRALTTLKWWCQSYLVGIQRIICGCKKDRSSIVIKIKEFKCSTLEKSSKINSLNPTICKTFCNEFLERVKTIVHEDYDKSLYKFTYLPGATHIKVDERKPNPQSEYTFLHSKYIAKAKQHFDACM